MMRKPRQAAEKSDQHFRIRFDFDDRVFVFFGPIDWHFRFQRPQSLASELAKQGERVIYVNPSIVPAKKEIELIVERRNEVDIISIGSNNFIHSWYLGTREISDVFSISIALEIENYVTTQHYASMIVVAQQPGWWSVVRHLQGNQLVFDCMDLHRGFEISNPRIVEFENELVASSDNVIVSSEYLYGQMRDDAKSRTLIVRNGVDIEHFRAHKEGNLSTQVRVGYFGAIAEWFDVELIEFVAQRNLEIEIELIGEITGRGIMERLSRFSNIRLLGELPRSVLPTYASTWSAGLIPFKLTELIRATNPVKMYEYAAMGLPIVSTAIPEVQLAFQECAGIFVSKTPNEFSSNIVSAIKTKSDHKMFLNEWASANSWSSRSETFLRSIQSLPKVSVVILMWNQGLMTLRCLQSVIQRSDYPNLEIVVVDNNSLDEEAQLVCNFIEKEKYSRIKYLRNSENVGFAQGNNVGIEYASGDYIVLLNNDTEVTPGWIWRSLKHFYRNPNMGLLGPSTNNCGNEARITLRGRPENWLTEVVPRFNFRNHNSFSSATLAFFCVFIPRETIRKIGLLSVEYGLGFFEDDDYCRRVQTIDLTISIARDIFVYHKMGASFDTLESGKKIEIFNRNRSIYEQKWGRWSPHIYSTDSDQ